jgi:hypothetical protein
MHSGESNTPSQINTHHTLSMNLGFKNGRPSRSFRFLLRQIYRGFFAARENELNYLADEKAVDQ